MVLASCLCSRADEMREDLRSKRSSGMDAEEAIRGYVLRYGQQVLSSPPKRGFNLAAWTGPLVAIIAGALILAGSLKNFVKRGRRRLETLKEGDEILPQLRTRVESELKKYM
jgi:cytochrome c-type biogenesis protein CcmH